MACMLSARGTALDVDAFLRKGHLTPYRVWRKGEKINGAVPERRQQSSGFSIVVSDCGRDDFPGQLKDATRFLVRNRAELKRLRKIGGLDEMWLEFGVLRRPDAALPVECFPDEFIEAAGQIPVTVSISHYAV